MSIALYLLSVICFAVYALTAAVFLLLHIWWKPRAYWFLYFLVATLAVWADGAIATWYQHEYLWEEMQQYEARGEQAPIAMVDDWAADAIVAMMPLFGWIPGLCTPVSL